MKPHFRPHVASRTSCETCVKLTEKHLFAVGNSRTSALESAPVGTRLGLFSVDFGRDSRRTWGHSRRTGELLSAKTSLLFGGVISSQKSHSSRVCVHMRPCTRYSREGGGCLIRLGDARRTGRPLGFGTWNTGLETFPEPRCQTPPPAHCSHCSPPYHCTHTRTQRQLCKLHHTRAISLKVTKLNVNVRDGRYCVGLPGALNPELGWPAEGLTPLIHRTLHPLSGGQWMKVM